MPSQRPPDGGVAAQQVARLHQQVVELQAALPAALVRVAEDQAAQRAQEWRQDAGPRLL